MKITIGGDFCPWNARSIDWILKNRKTIWGDVLECFRLSDYNVVNIEAPMTKYSESIFKTGPRIKLLPENIALLKEANIKLCYIGK